MSVTDLERRHCATHGHSWRPNGYCAVCEIFQPGDTHIETFSGRYLDLSWPDASSIELRDVAHGLSLICRYGGQVRRFYSVAEHAYLVAMRLRDHGEPLDVQLAGLHHDDAEAFIGDVTRPMKRRVPQVAELEADVFAAVVAALSIADLPFDAPAVKQADNWALAAEAYHLLPSKGATWFCAGMYDPNDMSAGPFVWTLGISPEHAERIWLTHHDQLCAEAGREEARP